MLNSNFAPIPRFLMLNLPIARHFDPAGSTEHAPLPWVISHRLKAQPKPSVDLEHLDALVGRCLVDVADSARGVGNKSHRRRVVVQALGHAGLTGKDQAAPSR